MMTGHELYLLYIYECEKRSGVQQQQPFQPGTVMEEIWNAVAARAKLRFKREREIDCSPP